MNTIEAIKVNYQTVTPEMIGACSKIISNVGNFWKVMNSKGEVNEQAEPIEYTVKALKINGKWRVTCDCKAGNEGRNCWHKRAAQAAEAELKAAMAEQARLADAAKAKRFIPTPSQDEINRFWAFRPECMDQPEREAFAVAHPDLVAEYIECWEEYLVK